MQFQAYYNLGIIVIIFRIFSAMFFSLWVLLMPIYWVIAKLFKFDRLKKDLCIVLNEIYNTTSFNHKDYMVIFYLFNGFVIRHKNTKSVLASGDYAWSGVLSIESDLMFPESIPNIYPLKFDNSPISNELSLQYAKGAITQINQRMIIEFQSNESWRLAQKTIYKLIAFSKNRSFELLELSLKTYDLEELYGNEIDYQEYPVSCYTINDLYLAYIIERMKDDPMTVSILPELVEDSVCDYNDSKFKDRLLLLDMVKF